MEPKKLKGTTLNVAQATESEGGVDDISLWLSSCSAVCSSLFLSKLFLHFISVRIMWCWEANSGPHNVGRYFTNELYILPTLC